MSGSYAYGPLIPQKDNLVMYYDVSNPRCIDPEDGTTIGPSRKIKCLVSDYEMRVARWSTLSEVDMTNDMELVQHHNGATYCIDQFDQSDTNSGGFETTTTIPIYNTYTVSSWFKYRSGSITDAQPNGYTWGNAIARGDAHTHFHSAIQLTNSSSNATASSRMPGIIVYDDPDIFPSSNRAHRVGTQHRDPDNTGSFDAYLADDEWHHFVYTFNHTPPVAPATSANATVQIYVDGEFSSTLTWSFGQQFTIPCLHRWGCRSNQLGANNHRGNMSYNMYMYYKTVLTAAEIKSIYRSQRRRFY